MRKYTASFCRKVPRLRPFALLIRAALLEAETGTVEVRFSRLTVSCRIRKQEEDKPREDKAEEGKRQKHSPTLKVFSQYPLAILLQESLREGKALGSEEGKVLSKRLCCEQSKEAEQGFHTV
jgi:hypothetical protein